MCGCKGHVATFETLRMEVHLLYNLANCISIQNIISFYIRITNVKGQMSLAKAGLKYLQYLYVVHSN